MATALFNGQLRGFQYAYNNLEKNLFEPLEVKSIIFLLPEDDRPKNVEGILSSKYNTHIVYEQEFNHDETGLPHPGGLTYSDYAITGNNYTLRGSLQHYFIQLYNKKRVYEIYKQLYNPQDSDIVLLLRPDLSPQKQLDINSINNDQINVPNCPQWHGVYDRLCITNAKNAKIYCDLYDNVKTLPPYGINNAESRLKAWLDKNGIGVNIFELGEVLRINIDGSSRNS